MTKKPSSTIALERRFAPSTTSVEQYLLKYFGRNPYYAMAKMVQNETTYHPVKTQLTMEAIQSHLKGSSTLGAYQLSPEDNTVLWLGWDVDSVDRETAKKFVAVITERLAGIPHAIEFSGSKGYHILVFLSAPMPAEQAKLVVDFVREAGGLPKTGKSHVECYPKQASLTKSNPMGNLLKIPLGLHPRTHNRSMFVDPQNGWEEGEEVDPLDVLANTVEPDQLIAIMKTSVDVRKQVVELLIPQWVSAAGEHHNFALHLSGYLANLGWGMEDTVALIQEIALKAGDQEVHNRVQAAEDT